MIGAWCPTSENTTHDHLTIYAIPKQLDSHNILWSSQPINWPPTVMCSSNASVFLLESSFLCCYHVLVLLFFLVGLHFLISLLLFKVQFFIQEYFPFHSLLATCPPDSYLPLQRPYPHGHMIPWIYHRNMRYSLTTYPIIENGSSYCFL